MRYPFPQDRTLSSARATPGSPVTVVGNLSVTFYTDAACTLLADLQTPDGTTVAGSTLTCTGQMPEFLGPDDVTVLYAKTAGADPWRVDAQFWAQIASVVSGTGSQGAPGKNPYQLAVDDGFQGTLTQWLASLVGPPGPRGPAGADSTVPGPRGPAGADSTVPGPRGPAGADSTVPGPKGDQGSPGVAATLAIGTVTNLPAGSTPTAANSGTPTAAVLDLGLVRGADGSPGVKGDPGSPGLTPAISVAATTLAAGSQATVVKSGTDAAPLLTFGIPKGADGAAGSGGSGGGEISSMNRNASIKVASFPPQMLDGNTAANSWGNTGPGGMQCVTVVAAVNATATKFAFVWSYVDPATTTAQVLVYDAATKAVLAKGTPILSSNTHQIVTLSATVNLVAGSEYVLALWVAYTSNTPVIACHAPVTGNPLRSYRTPAGAFIAFGTSNPGAAPDTLPAPGFYIDAMPYLALL